jgi:hypothetical protein
MAVRVSRVLGAASGDGGRVVSRGPTKQGIDDVRSLLIQLREDDCELRRLQRETAKMEEVRESIAYLQKQIVEKLESMDVHTRGNYGWEARTICFLSELIHISQSDRPEDGIGDAVDDKLEFKTRDGEILFASFNRIGKFWLIYRLENEKHKPLRWIQVVSSAAAPPSGPQL